MAFTWKDVVASEQYQSLESQEREKVRRGFFQEKVGPYLEEEEVQSAWDNFNERTVEDVEAGWGEVLAKSGMNALRTLPMAGGGVLQAMAEQQPRILDMPAKKEVVEEQPDVGVAGGGGGWGDQEPGLLGTLKKRASQVKEAVTPDPGSMLDIMSRAAQPGIIPELVRAKLESDDPDALGRQTLAQAGEDAAGYWRKRIEEEQPLIAEGESAKGYARDAIQGVAPSLAIGTAASYLSKAGGIKPGLAAMSPYVYGMSYSESRAEGLDEITSGRKALFDTFTEVASEAIPLGILTREGGNLILKPLKAGSAEGIQEMANQALQMGYEMGVLNKDIPPDQWWDQLKHAGIVGTIGGTAVGIPAAAADYLSRPPEPKVIEEDGTTIKVDPDGTMSLDPTVKPIEELMKPINISKIRRPTPVPGAPLTPDPRNLAHGMGLLEGAQRTQQRPDSTQIGVDRTQDYADILAGDLELAPGQVPAQPAPTRDVKVPQPKKEIAPELEPTVAPAGEYIQAAKPEQAAEIPTAGMKLEAPGARVADRAQGIDYKAEIDTGGLELEAPQAADVQAKPLKTEQDIQTTVDRVRQKASELKPAQVKGALKEVGLPQTGTFDEQVERVVASRELYERFSHINTEGQLRGLFDDKQQNAVAARLLNKVQPKSKAQADEAGMAGSWQNALNVKMILNRMGANIQTTEDGQVKEAVAEIEKVQAAPIKGQYTAPTGFQASQVKGQMATEMKLKSIEVDIPVRVRETGEVQDITVKADEAIRYEDGRISTLQKLRECLAG